MTRELFYVALGVLIAQRRRDRKLTQAALAELLGVTQPTIARIEAGRPVAASMGEALAKILGLRDLAGLIRRVEYVVTLIQRAAEAIAPGSLLRVPADGLAAFVVAALEKEVATGASARQSQTQARSSRSAAPDRARATSRRS